MSVPGLIDFSDTDRIDDFWRGLRAQFVQIDKAIEKCQMFLQLGAAEPELGDHLVSPRWGNVYTHHGIYVGEYTVAHYAGASGMGDDASVQKVSLDQFAGGAGGWGFIVTHHADAQYCGEKVVERALSRIGEDGYNLCINNCEHFANWCITGRHESLQLGLIDAFSELGRMRYETDMSVARFSGYGASLLVKALLSSGKAIVGAESNARVAKQRAERKLRESERMWVDSERLRSNLRRSFRSQIEACFAEAHTIADTLENEFEGGDLEVLHESMEAFLDKIGSEKRAPEYQEFKERFGFT